MNDATIMNDVIEKKNLKSMLNDDDILIVDRGFRDCIGK
jgi:hypothetical protein